MSYMSECDLWVDECEHVVARMMEENPAADAYDVTFLVDAFCIRHEMSDEMLNAVSTFVLGETFRVYPHLTRVLN